MLDVHKDAIAAATCGTARAEEPVFVGPIGTRQADIDKMFRRLQRKAARLISVHEAGPCGQPGASSAWSSLKAVMGHAIGASSAVQAALTVLAVKRGVVPSHPHLEEGDPEIRVALPRTAEARAIPLAWCNAFGFGGRGVSLVVGE